MYKRKREWDERDAVCDRSAVYCQYVHGLYFFPPDAQ